MVTSGFFSWFQVSFIVFLHSRFDFSWFQVGFYGFCQFEVGFHCLFIVPDLFVRVPRRSLWLSRLQRFVPSQFFTVPGWVSFFQVFFHVFLMVLGQFSWFS